jgi:hypothetical protein
MKIDKTKYPIKALEFEKIDKLLVALPKAKVVIETESHNSIASDGQSIIESRPKTRNVVTLAGAMAYTYDGIPKSSILGIFIGEEKGVIKFEDVDKFLKSKQK